MKKIAFLKLLILTCFLNISPYKSSNIINNYSFIPLFYAEVVVNSSPTDAEIYIDDIYKGKGYATASFDAAKIITITVKKSGYVTKTVKLKYKAPRNGEYLNLDRGENHYTISLEIDKEYKYTKNAAETKEIKEAVIFPKVDTTKNDEFNITGFYQPAGKFAEINPDFLETGKYLYYFGGGRFNYLDWPAKYTQSKNNLENFNRVQVMFSDFLPLPSITMYKNCNSFFEIENSRFYELPENTYNYYKTINSMYGSKVAKILKNKNAKKISISYMLTNDLAYDSCFSNNLILNLRLIDIDYNLSDKGKIPFFVKYVLEAYLPNGKLVKAYKQVCFIDYEKTSRNPRIGKHIDAFIRSTLASCFSSLLNQFLNDELTQIEFEKFYAKQSITVKQNLQKELNDAQHQLIQMKFKKTEIAGLLGDLGYKINGIDEYSAGANALMAVNPNQFNTYSPIPEVAAAGQQAAAIGSGAANLIGMGFALAAQNKARKKLEQTNALIDKLKINYEKLDIEEREIALNLNPMIRNSKAVLFLPDNKEIDKRYAENLEKNEELAQSKQSNLNTAYDQSMAKYKENADQITNYSNSINNTSNNSSTGNTALTDAYNQNQVKLNNLYNSQNPNNQIDPYANTINYKSSSSTNNSGNTSITDAYNQNQIKLNEFYNSQNPNNKIDPYANTINYDKSNSPIVESNAVTNNTNTNSNVCYTQAENELKQTLEYKECNKPAFEANLPQYNCEMSKAILIKLTLKYCQSQLPPNEIQVLQNQYAKTMQSANAIKVSANNSVTSFQPYVESAACKQCKETADKNYKIKTDNLEKKYYKCNTSGNGAAFACDGNVPPGCVCVAHKKHCSCDVCGKNIDAEYKAAETNHKNALLNCTNICK